MIINCAAISDIGKRRSMNQDAMFMVWNDKWGLFALADGMGGTSEGERASGEISNAYREWAEKYGEEAEHMSPGDLLTSLRDVLANANEKIIAETRKGETCGSTAVILFLREEFYIIISAGDSRIYTVNERIFSVKLKQLTVDDVWMAQGINSGKLTNAVGIFSPLKCHVSSETLQKKHIFFLCTDGVYKYCSEKKILDVIKQRRQESLEDKVEKIKEAIYQNGAVDNLSMILVECGK